MNIEPLESRIAPALAVAFLTSASTVTYNDVDGDHVTVTLSKPLLTSLTIANDVFHFNAGNVTAPNGGGLAHVQLQKIDLTSLAAEGIAISVAVKPVPGGDGLAAVGYINAGLQNLGAVTVKGDLGAIDCGKDTAGKPALVALNVDSMGRFGNSTQGGSGNLQSDINGALSRLNVHGDVKEAAIDVTGATAKIGPVFIGGSLIGGTNGNTGKIMSLGDIGRVKIGGEIRGGAGLFSGYINSQGGLAGLTVGGSVLGAGKNSAQIFSAGDMGAVKIGGDVKGGSGPFSGFIQTFGKLASLTISGSLIGGTDHDTGKIGAGGDIGAVKIGQNVQASEGGIGVSHAPPVVNNESGKIDAGEGGVAGSIASVTIGGSLFGSLGNQDTFTDAHGNTHDGQIFALDKLGPVKIGGDIQGSGGDSSAAIRSSLGDMATVTITGSLRGASGVSSGRIISGSSLGAVKIGGNVEGGAAAFSGDIVAKNGVASVTIAGSIVGGGGATSGQVFSAGKMGAVKVGRNLIGGTGTHAGSIEADFVTSVKIGGSVFGGTATDTGEILAHDTLGAVTIAGDFKGGGIDGTTGDLANSGFIFANRIVGVKIGGSVLAGTDDSTGGRLIDNASISAIEEVGPVVIKGSVVGTVANSGDVTPVVISARGKMPAKGTKDLAIDGLTIGGRAERLNVLAGFVSEPFSQSAVAINGNAQIGAVKIGGDFIASNLVAGVENYGANNMQGGSDDNINFGDGRDHVIGSVANSIAKIASIVVGGVIEGTPAMGDHFGIESHAIGSLKINGLAVAVGAAPSAVELLTSSTNDVTARIV